MRTLALLIALAGCGESLAPVDAPPNDEESVDARHPDAGLVVRDFSISVAPATVTLATPGSMVVTVKINRTGAPSTITLAATTVPANVTATFDPTMISASEDTAQLTIAVSAPTTGTLTVNGTGFVQHGEAAGVTTHTTTVMVTAD